MNKTTSLATPMILILCSGGPLMSQELTLDSYDLNSVAQEDAPTAKPTSEIETCLLDPSACSNSELRSGASLSIDDVVNLGVIDREQVAKIQTDNVGLAKPADTTQALPSIDMEILFDYNSANIRADQAVRLAELSVVLRGPKFQGYTFAFIGHTDAVGSDAFNRDLSRMRAQEVALFVSRAADIPLSKTSSTGVGFALLKTPSDPEGAQNRRVQLVLIPR